MTEAREPEAIVYPGAPLQAVAIEVRFPALVDASARFGTFQRRHAEFDQVYEASAHDDHAALPDGREFLRPRSTLLLGAEKRHDRGVSFARDQLAVITYTYDEGVTGFLRWALPLLQEGLADLGVQSVSSAAYRYENRIAHDTRRLDLTSILRLPLTAPPEAGLALRHVHLYWEQAWDGDTLVHVEVDGCPNDDAKRLRLNITANRRARDGSLSNIEPLMRGAHRCARATFEALITEEFRGKVLTRRPEEGSHA